MPADQVCVSGEGNASGVCVQGEVWQDSSYNVVALAAVGTVAGWALLVALKLGLGFALKRVAHMYVRHYDERHAKSRCGVAQALSALLCRAISSMRSRAQAVQSMFISQFLHQHNGDIPGRVLPAHLSSLALGDKIATAVLMRVR